MRTRTSFVVPRGLPSSHGGEASVAVWLGSVDTGLLRQTLGADPLAGPDWAPPLAERSGARLP